MQTPHTDDSFHFPSKIEMEPSISTFQRGRDFRKTKNLISGHSQNRATSPSDKCVMSTEREKFYFVKFIDTDITDVTNQIVYNCMYAIDFEIKHI